MLNLVRAILHQRQDDTDLDFGGTWHSAQGLIGRITGNYGSASSEIISESTVLGLSAYFACIRNISEDVAKLPLSIYRRLPEGGKEPATDHPYYEFLHNRPNPIESSMTFRETVTHHALGWRHGVAEIQRSGGGTVIGIWSMDPTRVVFKKLENGQYRYIYKTDTGVEMPMLPDNVLCIHGIGFGGDTGYSLPELAREALGAALAAQKYAGAFFGNGGSLSGILTHPGKLSDQALQHLRDSFNERHGGSEKAHKLYIAEEGITYTALGVDPDKAQSLECRKFSVDDVARWFRMPPHKIQSLEHATFSNIESENQQYVDDTLLSWLIRWEQELTHKLFRGTEYFAEHKLTGILRGDQAARSAYYRELFMIGAMSQNEIRELENQNPIGPDGDTYYVPLNLAPSGGDQAGAAVEPEPEPEPESNSITTSCDEDMISQLAKAHQPLMESAYHRLLRLELDKASRAEKRGKLAEWIEDFYGSESHLNHVAEVLRDVAEAFCSIVWAATVGGQLSKNHVANLLNQDGEPDYVLAMARRHTTESRRQLLERRTIDEALRSMWAARASRAAEAEMRELAKLMMGVFIIERTVA